MPPRPNRVNITHVFDGGWDVASGPSLPGLAPDAAGTFHIPFLLDAENVLFTLNGALQKAWGTTKLNASALNSGATVHGLFDFWRQGTGGSASQKRVAHVGSKAYADDADGVFALQESGLDTDAVISYNTFDDVLIISSSTDAPRSYDHTTWGLLSGSPPAFAFTETHKNRLFAAGVNANPSTLYYANQLSATDWSGGGSIDINPGDGDRITGIVSHKDELIIFKGPYKGSIHRLTGSSNSDFALVPYVNDVACVAHNTIFRIADDVGFMAPDGSVRLLSTTAAFGDYREGALSRPIQPWLDEHLTFPSLGSTIAVQEPGGRRVYFAVPIDGSTRPNALLVLDFGFSPARWTYLPGYDAASIARVQDTSTGRPLLFFGGSDGYVRKFNQPTRAIDGATAIAYKVTTPYIDYGLVWNTKTLAAAFVGLASLNDGNVTFAWQRDGNNQQTASVSQSGADVLGPADANQFILDTSVLGGARFLYRFVDQAAGGEFRAIQYQLLNSAVSEAVEIQSFGVSLEVGAVSEEQF